MKNTYETNCPSTNEKYKRRYKDDKRFCWVFQFILETKQKVGCEFELFDEQMVILYTVVTGTVQGDNRNVANA